jgi:hypothetical protein
VEFPCPTNFRTKLFSKVTHLERKASAVALPAYSSIKCNAEKSHVTGGFILSAIHLMWIASAQENCFLAWVVGWVWSRESFHCNILASSPEWQEILLMLQQVTLLNVEVVLSQPWQTWPFHCEPGQLQLPILGKRASASSVKKSSVSNCFDWFLHHFLFLPLGSLVHVIHHSRPNTL